MPVKTEKYSKSWLCEQYNMSLSSVALLLNTIANDWRGWAERRPEQKDLYQSFEGYNRNCKRITPKQLECLYFHIGKPE